MFIHGKRIGRILYVKTLGGKWIEFTLNNKQTFHKVGKGLFVFL